MTNAVRLTDPPRPIRVTIQQPALAAYRVPVFAALACRPGIELNVLYGDTPGLPNAPALGFDAQWSPMRRSKLLGHPIYWHHPQWQYATRRMSDVLILTWDLHFTSLVPALVRARLNNVPTILWGHGYSKKEARWRSWPRQTVAKLGTSLLFYSHSIANRYIQDGWKPERIYVALNSIDQAPIQAAKRHWNQDPQRLQSFRRQHGLQGGPIVLFVARLSPDRRLDLLIEAAVQLIGDFPTLQIVIVGQGDLQATLRAQADALQLGERVIFVGAEYDQLKLAPWFMSANAFCFPSAMGLSVLHAFGYGLPVVTSNNKQAHGPEIEALRDGENGYLFEEGSASALAVALRRVLGDPDLAQRMSHQATQTITDQFCLNQMVNGMEAAIQYSARRVTMAPIQNTQT